MPLICFPLNLLLVLTIPAGQLSSGLIRSRDKAWVISFHCETYIGTNLHHTIFLVRFPVRSVVTVQDGVFLDPLIKNVRPSLGRNSRKVYNLTEVYLKILVFIVKSAGPCTDIDPGIER